MSVNKAKYVTKINLKDCGLTNQEGISVITNINRSLVKELDLSGNSTLTSVFYEHLGEMTRDKSSVLERIELEDNRVGDQIVLNLIECLIDGGKIAYLNLNKNNITDVGAKSIANLIEKCPNLRLLFLHYNKILGMGGV